MAEDKNIEQPKKKGKRGKSKIQKKLDVLKKILKDGTKEHIDAIDKVIQQYDDYKNLASLEKDLAAMQARVEAAKVIQAKEIERQKAEEAKKQAEEKKSEEQK